jgi:hypothetical protein
VHTILPVDLKQGVDERAADGVARVLAVTMGVSTIIGGEDEGHVIYTGTLLGVEVRAADA